MPDGRNGGLDYYFIDVTAGLSGGAFPQFERPAYVLETYKWGSGTRGTSGGIITWAVVTAGQPYPSQAAYTSQASGISAAFLPTIRAAFARWDEVGNFTFVETSSPMTAGITLIFDELQGQSANTLGLAYTWSAGSTIANSYISFDIGRRYRLIDGTVVTVGSPTSTGTSYFYTLVLHEIGHALGLGHEDDFDTVMNSFQDPFLTDLTSDDIAGIRGVYGSPSTTPTADDYPASTATSASVAVGGTATGRIDDSSDEDWFRVALTAGTTYRIDVRGYDSGGGTLLDPYVRILNPSLSQIASDDDSGTGTDSQILYTVTATGTYYIAASGFDGEQGTYTVAVATTTTADDYAASSSTTGAVAVGGFATGRLETSTDTDWFAVTLTGGQSYRIEVRGSASAAGTLADPYVRVRSSSGVIYASDNDSGTGADAQVTYVAAFTGVHYIEAATQSSGTGSYTVAVSNVTPTDDYSATTATSGTVLAGGSATGNIETGNDRDWFRVTLASGTTYRFDLRGAPTSGGTLTDPYLVLRDGSGTQLGFDDDSGSGLDAQISYTVVTGGTYYLEARSANATGTGTYTLSAGPTAVADDFAATTSTSGLVTPGTPGSTVSGTINTAGDTDWFRVSLTAGTPYRFRLNNGTLLSSVLNLRDSAGTLVTSDSDGIGNPEIVYAPAASGTFYLDVRAATATGTGTYTIAADNISSADDYGATAATAGSMNIGATLTGNIGQPADVDWVRVTLQAGTLYRFDGRGSASSSGSLADPVLTIRNASGGALVTDNNSGDGADARIFYTPATSGSHYLSIQSTSATAIGTYSLTATANPDDYAASVSTTGTVAAGTTAVGIVETAGDRDWFRTTLTAGTVYNIEVRGTSAGSGIRWTESSLVVRNSSGTALTGDTESGLGAAARLIFTPSASGTFYIDTLAYGTGVGSYTVSVTPATSLEAPAVTEETDILAAITAPAAVDLNEYTAGAWSPAPYAQASPLVGLLAAADLPEEDRHRLEAAMRTEHLLFSRENPFSLPPLG
ncbi:MAG: pre-peptidase C-terminal domain-containing protein [Rhodospirillaceae bacterium]